ncbi:MAG: hypothetical protein Ct9H300mP1_33200 [Planctomycetaceae bacterium]|nr:MAG: hypothetical protein Ct9H300mP1_33200 [Planctomycetaceae bacterium]
MSPGSPCREFSRPPRTTPERDLPRSGVMIYLCGGPTQHETFDPQTRLAEGNPGVCSHQSQRVSPASNSANCFPRVSATAHRFSVVRTLTGMQNRHESFQCYSGRPGGRNGDNEPAGGWPTFGSVASRVLGPGARWDAALCRRVATDQLRPLPQPRARMMRQGGNRGPVSPDWNTSPLLPKETLRRTWCSTVPTKLAWEAGVRCSRRSVDIVTRSSPTISMPSRTAPSAC